MKVIYGLLIFLVFTSVSMAQNFNQFDANGKRHGKWQKKYEGTDVLRYEGEFFHGKEIGLFKFYKNYKNRAVLSATKQFNPENELAEVKFFTSSGKLVGEGKMDGKTYVGTWKYYQKNNENLLTLEHYNDKGQLDGERFVYYPNEQVAEKQNYVAGKLHGESVWYSENNVIVKSYHYENGELHGPAKFFNKKGELICEGNYKNSEKHGVWKYYENGNLAKQETF
ncbi:toxin-antitoxin system YwqK family antitoxin [Tamlana crocina]|uniref:Toxin-antitoxin system YwqK family antitoxin n=1 Tax=Tamlana crocina TaxID=393006 RepID=A0ABX1DB55_9FLAO|nr:toxin-antitoxin system YwqK family antitoxin [Tamlana crocina]NJX14268.1 toxin-antitoxin system YwqK family antitoxin [Tamlana crocina]